MAQAREMEEIAARFSTHGMEPGKK